MTSAISEVPSIAAGPRLTLSPLWTDLLCDPAAWSTDI